MGISSASESTYEQVIQIINEGMMQLSIENGLGVVKATVIRYVRRGKAEGRIPKDGEL